MSRAIIELKQIQDKNKKITKSDVNIRRILMFKSHLTVNNSWHQDSSQFPITQKAKLKLFIYLDIVKQRMN